VANLIMEPIVFWVLVILFVTVSEKNIEIQKLNRRRSNERKNRRICSF